MFVVMVVPITLLADSWSYSNGYYLANSGSLETRMIGFIAATLSRIMTIQGAGIVVVLAKTVMLSRISKVNYKLFKSVLLIYFLPGTLLFTAYPNKDSLLLLTISSLVLIRSVWIKNIMIICASALKPFVLILKMNRVRPKIFILFIPVLLYSFYYIYELGYLVQLYTYLDLHLNNVGDSTYGVNILKFSVPKTLLYLIETAIFGIPLTFITLKGTALLMLMQQLAFLSMFIHFSMSKGNTLMKLTFYFCSALFLIVPLSLFNAGAALRYSVIFYLVFVIYLHYGYSNTDQ